MTPIQQRWEKATRYYQVDICQDLWGPWVLIQRWGRCGTALGQTRRVPCDAYADALSLQAHAEVLQALLRERVSVRDLETILDAISDCADLSSDVEALTARARSALSRALSQQYCGRDGKLRCVSLPARLERTLEGAFVSDRPRGGGELARKATVALAEGLGALRRQGHPPVVLCSPALRPALRKALSAVEPAAAVLAYNEIESTEIESVEIGVEE